MTETVWLQRPSGDVPWGFRLQGGRDYQTPLSVQKVTSGSIASTGLTSGDVILKIGEADTSSLTYTQAMDVLKNCGNLLQLSIMKQGGQYPQSSKVDAESNMASGAVHDLFQDMYRYTDPATYPQEGARSHNTPQPSSYPCAQPTQSYQPSNPSTAKSYTNGQGYGTGSNYPSAAGNYQDRSHDRPSYQSTGPSSGPSFPPQAPPSYSDVQTHRDQVAYPYNPTPSSGSSQHPYQSNTPLGNQYPYPHSVSSSTSELSDISSGIGTSDGKPCGSSPALGRPMTSPGGITKPYTSGSSVDSSSGVGSYSCETPEQTESAFHTKTEFGRQDSFPPPPPPLPNQASYNTEMHNTPDSFPDTPSVVDYPKAAPPPAPPLPPPPPPPPPPPSKWKAKPNEDKTAQPPTRLEQQLSNMSVGSDYGRQNSFPAPPPPIAPAAYQPQSPQSYTPSYQPGAPAQTPYYGGQSPAYTPASPSTNQPQRAAPAMPDAVLNMAAKGEPDKKPWAYAPDMDSIKEQRDRVRRRAPAGGMPKYQQLLNLPQFDDTPRPHHVGPKSPPTPSHAPQTPEYTEGPGQATVAHLQYNSPLKMYSEQNVSDAFTGQTDGVVTGVDGVKKDQNPDITQSPVYKMIHGLDSSKPRARPVPAEGKIENGGNGSHIPPESSSQSRGPSVRHGVSFRVLQWLTETEENECNPPAVREKPTRAPANDDELTFTGIHTSSDIPSKSFHRLQNMTGGSEIDTTSIRANVSGDEEVIGNYDQASIRYTGRNIPSKSFRMLQSMTGPEPPMQSGPARRQRRKPEPQIEENPDDIVDISYVGGNIPSRSFKVLQHAVGQTEQHDEAHQTAPINSRGNQNADSNPGQGRTVKVIRLRQQPSLDSEPSGVTDF